MVSALTFNFTVLSVGVPGPALKLEQLSPRLQYVIHTLRRFTAFDHCTPIQILTSTFAGRQFTIVNFLEAQLDRRRGDVVDGRTQTVVTVALSHLGKTYHFRESFTPESESLILTRMYPRNRGNDDPEFGLQTFQTDYDNPQVLQQHWFKGNPERETIIGQAFCIPHRFDSDIVVLPEEALRMLINHSRVYTDPCGVMLFTVDMKALPREIRNCFLSFFVTDED